MDDSKLITPTQSLSLDLPPSCVQFCPAHPDFFVVGTYNLEKDEDDAPEVDEELSASRKAQSRSGSLVVFKLDSESLLVVFSAALCREIRMANSNRIQVQTLSQPSALLDLRFHPNLDKQDTFATVSSTGTLSIFKLDPTGRPSSPLQHLATSRCDDLGDDVLFLQCNWHPAIRDIIFVTTSTGLARVLYLDDEWNIKGSHDLDIQNTLEAWCIALSSDMPTTDEQTSQVSIYCGGDDSIMRYTSCSWDSKEANAPYEPATVKGQHDAGVTAILPLPLFSQSKGRLVVTGSYDEYLRVFVVHDLHATYGLKRVELVADIRLGGGVWRLDLVDIRSSGPSTRARILASCMHAGARLVEIESGGDGWTCKVLCRFEEHKSMNYGSDSMPVEEGMRGGRLRCVSTSFYDRLLCLWGYEPDR